MIEEVKNINNIKRFTKFIQLDILSGCWNWKGSLATKGYAQIRINSKKIMAHRFSYVYWNGEIPHGLIIHHKCRNRKCVNPAHLEAITNKENVLQGISFCALNSKKTHCPQGHEYTAKNTQLQKFGRSCKICNLQRAKEYAQNNRERCNLSSRDWKRRNRKKMRLKV